MKLAVLASGSGTILEAIVSHSIPVALVIVDRPCRAGDLALANGIALNVIERTDFTGSFDRRAFTTSVTTALLEAEIDVVAMAGYGTVLTQEIHDAYRLRILNTHPSLLPAFPGWHAVREALNFGVRVTGCTVHIATAVVDSGPILAQSAVEVLEGDDEGRLHERIKEAERVLYPKVIASFMDLLESLPAGNEVDEALRRFHV